ncbi:MAG: thermosome subunit alpha [Nanoarchaeota archaeon]
MTQQNQQPIFILAENTQRTKGRDAQSNNIMAAKLVAETVRTTLGPKGMDKMLVDSMGDIIVTNDGVTILEEMHIEHPAAKMIVEVAKTQENEVGDGTTTAVIIAGELLKNAERLLEQEIHPTVIIRGYRIAAERANETLEQMAEKINENDIDMLRKIAITAMTGKGAETAKEMLSDLIVRAVKQITEKENNKIILDTSNIKIEKKVGGGIEDSELIQGVVLDKGKAHSGMPSSVKNAKILLIDSAIEIKSPETDTKISITSPDQIQAFIDQEEKILKEMVEKIAKSGANVVFCQKGIDDIAHHYLYKKGIYAVRRVSESDTRQLALATKAKIVTNLDDLKSSDLGYAGLVEEAKIGDEEMTFVRDCKNGRAVTILIKGGTEHVVAEVERAVKDAIGDIAAGLKIGRIVAGAGSVEVELSRHIRKFATSLSGREQLAILAFADALEIIPRTLAENAGLDPIDIIAELKGEHDKGKKWAGINVFSGKVMDAWKSGVIEPLKIKTQAIESASEVTELILRIDDVIAASGINKNEQQMPPNMPMM